MSSGEPAIIVLTANGLDLGRRVQNVVGGEVHGYEPRVSGADVPFDAVAAHLVTLFRAGRPIIGICAAGILVRCLAPLLADKTAEPPVLALAEDGTAVVPLLGGHHDGNELAQRIAAALNVEAAITTAGELSFGVALDAPPRGWRVGNPDLAKAVMATLLAGEPVILEIEAGSPTWLTESDMRFADTGDWRVVATDREIESSSNELVLHPATLALGVGCERGADPGEVRDLARSVMAESVLSPLSLACVVSLDLKTDEPAILDLAEEFGVPARFFTAEHLEEETPRLANPSETVFREVGCHGVAEAAGLAAVGNAGSLVVAKRKSARATVALARAPGVIDATDIGRAPGRLRIIGIGPGQAAWRTAEAVAALGAASDVVGYRLYLDLVADLIAGKSRHEFPLGEETARAEHALTLASEGRDVALVSSGDAGIYAMAALVFELTHRSGNDAWRRTAIDVIPGISALQAAAARAGAPLGHDFCAISLSDLLTPHATIEARLEAAAAADFVIALYNPASKTRHEPLTRALAILRDIRAPETPVVVARALGRPDEQVTITTLAALNADAIDMSTLLLIGSSESRIVDGAGSEKRVYTPRGYGGKWDDDGDRR